MRTYYGRDGVERDAEAQAYVAALREVEVPEFEAPGGDVPAHPNSRCTPLPQVPSSSPSPGAEAARLAGTSYARFVEFGRSEGTHAAPAIPDSPEAWLRPADLELEVEASLDAVRESIEQAAQHLEDHTFEFEAEITIPEDMAEDLRKEMGLE